jgi:hypothetical protein
VIFRYDGISGQKRNINSYKTMPGRCMLTK